MNVMLQDQRRNGGWRTAQPNGSGWVAAPLTEVDEGAVVVVDIDALKDDELANTLRLHCERADCVLGMTSSADPQQWQRLLQLGLDGIVPAGAESHEIRCAVASARYQAGRSRGLRKRVEELERKLEDRILIERAKGIIATRAQIGEEEALQRLRREARNQRRTMREIAQRLIDAERMLKAGL